MMQKISLLAFAIALITNVNAQELLTPSFSFSKKKTAYITLTDGTEIQGNIKDIDRKKGLIEEIKIKDGKGKKHKLKPEDIKYMYLKPSNFDKLTTSAVFDATKWNDESINQKLLKDGYVFFETADVKLKKKNLKLLMQLLNPNFCKQVRVYHDPFAKQTTSIGVGPVKLAGGNAKSYYIAKAGKTAYRLKKKDYKDEFTPMWKSCAAVAESFPKKKWKDLVKHILAYADCK